MASKIPNIESYKVDGKVDKTLMPTRILKKYEAIYEKYNQLITPLLSQDSSIQPESEVKVISEPYGVVSYETNPSKDKTKEFVNIIQPQIQQQAYKENIGKDANDMFMYGLRWTRKSNSKAPLNNKSYANKGLPINDAKASDNYVYDTVDQNGNPLAPVSDLLPIISEIENSLGIDMSNYDAVIGNIYLPGQNISTHRDTTESLSARNYPVLVYTIGNNSGISVYENEKKPGSTSFASDKKTTINTKNGSIYTFGMDGKGRFEVAHDTPKGISRDVDFPPITMPNGKVITNYTITLTFRRAADLEQGMPSSPEKLNKSEESTQSSTISDKVLEGDIFTLHGIPVITTNLGGIHGAGLAQAAKAKGLIKQGDGSFKANEKVVQLPVKKKWSDSMAMNDNMKLLKEGLRSLIKVSKENPSNNYLLPLAGLGHGEGSIEGILPLLIKTVQSSPNIKIVLPAADVNLGRQGTVRKDYTRENLPKIKQMLSEAGLMNAQQSTSTEVDTESVTTATEEVAQPVTAELTPGQYVKYNNETYIVTQENNNGTIQIYNPNLVGASNKISVSKDKLTALKSKAKIVENKGANYIVTPSNTIISMTSNKVMKYLENDGNKKAILEKAGNNITKAPEVKVEQTNYLTETKSQPQSQMSFKPANKQQEDAITAIKDFIENGNPQEIFMLEGKAGTGKTTMVQEALADSVAKGKNIQIAALSHKAKLVLASKLEERYTKKSGSRSNAGLLGMTMDQENGEFEPGYGMERPIENADIIVIDEASMVNEESLGLIMSEKRRGAKVIFLGDRGQLPPIRKLSSDEISPVFESPNKASLTERVRQGEESPILPFADYFWDNSESSSPKANPIPEGEIKDTHSEKGNLVFINNLNDAFDDVVETFRKGVNEKNFNVRKIATYRNSTKQSYNNKIRREIFGEEVPQFVVKDQIMFQNNYTLDKYTTFSNSDEFAIEQVNETTKNGYKVFDIGVIMSSKENKLTYFPVIHKEDKAKIDEDVSKRFEAAKAMPKGDLRKFAYQQAWSLKGMFAEIDYSYAITSHKSQGSTYDNVIVDLKDIYGVGATSNKSKSQSVYTALTRAKNTAIVITSKSETNNDNVKKSLSISKKITLTKEQQDKADEKKKYCNPG